MAVKCPQCRSADVEPLLADEWTCLRCAAKFAGDKVLTEGSIPEPLVPSPGFMDVQDADDVTVAYASTEPEPVPAKRGRKKT